MGRRNHPLVSYWVRIILRTVCFLLSAVSHPNLCSLLYFCWKVNDIKLFKFSLLQLFWHHTLSWTIWVLLITINYFFNDYSCGCFISFCSDLLFIITDIFSDSDLDVVQSMLQLKKSKDRKETERRAMRRPQHWIRQTCRELKEQRAGPWIQQSQRAEQVLCWGTFAERDCHPAFYLSLHF